MNSEGGFSLEEADGKLTLVYQHPKYCPIPQTQSPTSSVEAANLDHSSQPLFLCPISRWQKDFPKERTRYFPLISSPQYVRSTPRFGHHVLPLFWCNNKEFDVTSGCNVCRGSNFGTDYYFCEIHETKYHKECAESPVKIKHPYHPQHRLQLYYYRSTAECYCCGRDARNLVYYCAICEIFMHPICAMMPIPFVIDQPKRHDHPLTFFPRQTSLTCNICGLLEEKYPTYICLICNFVAHKDCMYFPRIIRISRHHHRISYYISSLPSEKWFCGVCRQPGDGGYGAYNCDKCSDYAVHPRCALGKDVCDGEELEGVPEEDDITQDAGPFDMIAEGVIFHFLHSHHLRLKVSMLYDENKFCQACVLPIFEGNFYSCMTCDFILHETCANAPRRIQHALHPHPLTLKAKCRYGVGAFGCNACYRLCRGFVYECPIAECTFDIDVRCALISEPFAYRGHEHPLFLALKPVKTPICHICKTKCRKQLNCIKCDFIVCIKCATLPYRVRYKHDEHFLTIVCGEEVRESEWCEICERDLGIMEAKVFYRCSECYTTFHIECLFGGDIYIKPGQFQEVDGTEVHILSKRNISRPFCDSCKNRCEGKIFKTDENIACSMECIQVFIEEV